MTRENKTENEISEIIIMKSRLIKFYLILTICFLFILSVLFRFFIINNEISLYTFSGVLLLSFFLCFSTYKYSLDRYIRSYLLIAPLSIIYPMGVFWENSVGCFVSFFPAILAIHIFFDRKVFVFFILYFCVIFFLSFLLHSGNIVQSPIYHRPEVIIADIIYFVYIASIIIMLFIFKEKMYRIKLSKVFSEEVTVSVKKDKKVEQGKNMLQQSLNRKKADDLFTELENLMKKEMLYKDPNIDISKTSVALNTSYSYLSKTIKHKGFTNFNHYINTYRVRAVKRLLEESDLEKVTFMYIYTEAGFSNQSTFNRSFKQIEGTTPSEYVKKQSAQ